MMGIRNETHKVDFCVVGGGLAGACAAIAAARRGMRVALVQDRPVLGGNASSEIRMWVCGARGADNRETGIIEEILLENRYRNPQSNFCIWDSILYEKVRFEPNITLLLNTTCNDIRMQGKRIAAVRAWQMTTETWHWVEAPLFADCSGDSILAPLSGAEYRWGRESCQEFGEDIAPNQADQKTMGLSCLLQARETDRPQPFIAPMWAYKYETDVALGREHNLHEEQNFWWIEVGGENNAIHDAELLRDELLKITFGVWDHIKNHGDHGAENWVLEWVGFLPGKRESRRYVGDHIITQNDVRQCGQFDDLVAYGGWPMDDHHPAGFKHAGEPTVFHPAPSPFGIPLRSLYSQNIENLFCAGRNISATHAAMSSTRVMATCAIIGQAVGTAAVLAGGNSQTPRNVYEKHITELQQYLQEDDSYLPWRRREISVLAREAQLTASQGDPEPLRNGIDRPVEGRDNAWTAEPGDWACYRFDQLKEIREARFIFDSDLNRGLDMRFLQSLQAQPLLVPACMVKAFRLEALDAQGRWQEIHREQDNHQRLVRIPLQVETAAVRFVVLATWGVSAVRVFAWEVK